ncbi:hypothetical protein [Nocardia beijingensis]|uniref:hypothetical protein n=1 Tax=Nocardia beijingensis TaxID=95162 RepID=UPI001894BBE6|nr:hypothetical protein [Nocardia beijingensis]
MAAVILLAFDLRANEPAIWCLLDGYHKLAAYQAEGMKPFVITIAPLPSRTQNTAGMPDPSNMPEDGFQRFP